MCVHVCVCVCVSVCVCVHMYHLHPACVRNSDSVIVDGPRRRGANGKIGILLVARAQLAFVVVAPKIDVAQHVNGGAVKGACRCGDERQFFVCAVHVSGRRGQVALCICVGRSKVTYILPHGVRLRWVYVYGAKKSDAFFCRVLYACILTLCACSHTLHTCVSSEGCAGKLYVGWLMGLPNCP